MEGENREEKKKQRPPFRKNAYVHFQQKILILTQAHQCYC